MKTNIFSFFTAALPAAAALWSASVTFADTPRIEATATTVNSAGTVTEFGSQSISVKTEKGATPIRYISNETTNYVDESGNPVSRSTVKSGQPVTVFYTKVGDTLVASKVMVRTDKPATGRNAETPKSSEIVPDKVVVERVPANENVRPVSAATSSGLAGGRMIDGFVMSNGRVFQVSRGQALPLTQDLTFRATPTGFFGFDGQFEGLPEGLMLSSTGAIVRAPVGLRDVNGNVFAMRSFNGSSNTTATTGSSTVGTDRRSGTTSTTGPSGTVSTDGFPAFEFIPLTQSGTQTATGSQTATRSGGRVTSPTGTSTTSTTPALNGTGTQTSQPQSTTPTSQPQTTQPQSTQSQTTQPQSTQPQTTQPQSTQPQTTQPQSTQPQTGTRPQSTTNTGSPAGTGTATGGTTPAPSGSGDIGAKQR